MNPLVSIIIPCYNQGAFIGDALDSVSDQDYDRVEVIIVDDGSTDPSTRKELAARERAGYRVIRQENKGLPEARNSGINQASGEYILPLDADDFIRESYVRKALAVFMDNPGVKVVYGLAEFTGARSGPWRLPDFSMAGMLRRNLIYCSALFRRSDFLEAGGYDREMINGWEDWDLWLRIIRDESEVYRIPETMFYYRIKETSMVTEIERDISKRQHLEQKLLTKHITLYHEYFPEPITMLRELDTLRRERLEFERYKQDIRNSASYRIGNILLSPLKLARKLIRR